MQEALGYWGEADPFDYNHMNGRRRNSVFYAALMMVAKIMEETDNFTRLNEVYVYNNLDKQYWPDRRAVVGQHFYDFVCRVMDRPHVVYILLRVLERPDLRKSLAFLCPPELERHIPNILFFADQMEIKI